ncbi:hypothetical protein [Sphingomonas bacterium]|nr:hypothetical protein [Sphingomonas bacterium]
MLARPHEFDVVQLGVIAGLARRDVFACGEGGTVVVGDLIRVET